MRYCIRAVICEYRIRIVRVGICLSQILRVVYLYRVYIAAAVVAEFVIETVVRRFYDFTAGICYAVFVQRAVYRSAYAFKPVAKSIVCVVGYKRVGCGSLYHIAKRVVAVRRCRHCRREIILFGNGIVAGIGIVSDYVVRGRCVHSRFLTREISVRVIGVLAYSSVVLRFYQIVTKVVVIIIFLCVYRVVVVGLTDCKIMFARGRICFP